MPVVSYGSLKPTGKQEQAGRSNLSQRDKPHLICALGPLSSYFVDYIGGNPYEPRPKKRIAKKIAQDYDNLVSIINALILRRNQGQTPLG